MDTVATMDRRVTKLREILGNEIVCRIAGTIESLPSLPETYNALCRAAANPLSSVQEITQIIETDPAISVRLLQLVNSAFFGMAPRTTSIPKAVGILGTNLLKSLVLSAHMCNAMERNPTRSFSISKYQAHSLRVARFARRLAGTSGPADDAFTAGIMLGVGQIVLALQVPTLFEDVLQRVANTHEAQHAVEQEIIGTTHAEIGAFLLSMWGIPFSIVESVAFHCHPNNVGAGDCHLLALVHVADALIGIIACKEPESRLDLEFLERAGVLKELPAWRRVAYEYCEPLE